MLKHSALSRYFAEASDERRRRRQARADVEYVRQVSLLCHPAWGVRAAAAASLSDGLAKNGGPLVLLGTAVDEPLSRRADLETLLSHRGITPERAGAILVRALEAAPPQAMCAAVSALGALEYGPAASHLAWMLSHRPPELYVASVRALARLGAREIAPVLTAFAVASPSQPSSVLPFGLPIRVAMSLELLLNAYRWFSVTHGSGYPSPPPRSLTTLPLSPIVVELRTETPALAGFASDALRRLGETVLLRAAQRISSGLAPGPEGSSDGRLFPALVVALARSPENSADAQICMAAIAGLEALGDVSCLAVLEACGRRRPAGAHRPLVLAARAAAERLRQRQRVGLGEVSPTDAPAGSGSELAPAARPGSRAR